MIFILNVFHIFWEYHLIYEGARRIFLDKFKEGGKKG